MGVALTGVVDEDGVVEKWLAETVWAGKLSAKTVLAEKKSLAETTLALTGNY